MKHFTVIAMIFGFTIGSFAQSEIPLNQLIDSTKKYYTIDLAKSKQFAYQAIALCDTSDCITYGECLKNIGVVHYYHYKIDTAELFYNKALKVYEKCSYNKGIQATINNLGVLNMIAGNREKALTYYDQSYEIALEMQDTLAIIRALSNLSNVYYDMRNYPKSLSIIEKAIPLINSNTNKRMVTSIHANIYSSYRYLNDYPNWKKHIATTSKMIHELKDSAGIARLYTNLATGLFQFKTNWAKETGLPVNKMSSYEPLMDSIIKLNTKALSFFKSNKQQLEVVHIYEKLGEVYQFLKDFKTSTQYFEKALIIAIENNIKSYMSSLYTKLNINMIFTGNIEKMDDYQVKIMKLDAELIEDEVSKKMANFEVKYQTLEKEREIERQRLTIEKQEAVHQRQTIFRNFLLITTFLLIVLIVFIYKNYLNKKKRNQIITEKNALLIEANEEIRAQNEEIQSQRDTVMEQKSFIEKQKQRLDDSILYAQRIQNAALPSTEQMQTLLKKHFIIFKPKDVVSGDFYWILQNNQNLFVAVADCTGHGVPGAFMSMLGITFLNEIISRNPQTQTGDILNHLRNEIINALRQKSDSKSQRDSIEISLLKIDMQTLDSQWSGAGIPLWIVRQNEEAFSLQEFTPDKMPVGIFHKIENFHSKSIKLQHGDRIVMATDGFADQFGGNTGKRYMTTNLKQKIIETSQLNTDQQQVIINNELQKWMQSKNGESVEQIDDITILCFEV